MNALADAVEAERRRLTEETLALFDYGGVIYIYDAYIYLPGGTFRLLTSASVSREMRYRGLHAYLLDDDVIGLDDAGRPDSEMRLQPCDYHSITFARYHPDEGDWSYHYLFGTAE